SRRRIDMAAGKYGRPYRRRAPATAIGEDASSDQKEMPGSPSGPSTDVLRLTSSKSDESAPSAKAGSGSGIANRSSVAEAPPSKRSSSSRRGTSGRITPGLISQWRKSRSRHCWKPTGLRMITGRAGDGTGAGCRHRSPPVPTVPPRRSPPVLAVRWRPSLPLPAASSCRALRSARAEDRGRLSILAIPKIDERHGVAGALRAQSPAQVVEPVQEHTVQPDDDVAVAQPGACSRAVDDHRAEPDSIRLGPAIDGHAEERAAARATPVRPRCGPRELDVQRPRLAAQALSHVAADARDVRHAGAVDLVRRVAGPMVVVVAAGVEEH